MGLDMDDLESLVTVSEAGVGSKPHLRVARACMLIESLTDEEVAELSDQVAQIETVGPLMNPGSHDFEQTDRIKARVDAIKAAREHLPEAEGE